jgi:hypothetical protein
MNTETLNIWVTQYNEKKTLPNKKVPCSCEGCQNETTLFSNNLHKRVKKFKNITTLLTTFKCRSCEKADKPTKSARTSRRSIESLVKATVNPTETVEVAAATMSTEELLSVFDE